MLRLTWWAVAMAVGLSGLLTTDACAVPSKQEKKTQSLVMTREGKILIVRGLNGGEPQLTDGAGQRWLISGTWREEILRLDGHKVKVWATLGPKKLMMPTLDVSRYEILEIGGGRRPLVGMLRKNESQIFYLEGDQKENNIEIKADRPMLAALEKRVGCKVWIAGDLMGKNIKVFKFGWISCKPPHEQPLLKDLKPTSTEKEKKK